MLEKFLRKYEKLLLFHIFIKGCFMGLADLVPGISGGTIAFITGIYDELLVSISSLNLDAAKYLFSFQFSKFFKIVKWQFLLPLISGIAFSIISFSYFFHVLLSNIFTASMLYSIFFGCLLASLKYLISLVVWKKEYFIALVVGIILSFFLTSLSKNGSSIYLANFIDIKIIVAGILAISAMLLPGMSGSYVLILFGLYPTVIKSIAEVTTNINSQAVIVLINLSMGVFLGAVLFSRFIHFCIKKYYFWTLTFLMGLMIGSFHIIWPFKEFKFGLPNILFLQNVLSISFIFIGYFFFAKLKQKNLKKNKEI